MPPVDTIPANDLPAAQRQALESWAARAQNAGWLPPGAAEQLQTVSQASPSRLFDTDERPLVAGLFGGTGVGKSTLLNRLAGEDVARASAERPTSRNITVYVHRSQVVDRLPSAFPMQRMRTALHNNDRYRHVMFIDMPDFDSVETANRELVDIWLPHLDVVLYVVSPDRYRDDQGWRLLLRHAAEHAWLFVMNHWDRGDPAQLDDFRQQLTAAGLERPLVFRSDASARSSDNPGREDDFESLCQTLTDLADEAVIRSLNELGILARLKALKAVSDGWLEALADDARMQQLQSDWSQHWQQAADALGQQLQPRAARLAAQQAGQRPRLFGILRDRTPASSTPSAAPLVDEALLQRVDTVLADFLNRQGQQTGIASAALKQAIAEPYARARRDIEMTVDDALQRSLAAPGSAWHRRLHTLLGALSLLLPLAAMGWIGWRVVNGFAQGAADPGAYLGSNFAINGALLLGLSWLVPAFLHRRLAPSRERAAMRGLQQGMRDALAGVSAAVSGGFDTLQAESRQLREAHDALWQTLPQPAMAELPDTVRRMLAEQIRQPVPRSLDVRANTHSSTDSAPLS